MASSEKTQTAVKSWTVPFGDSEIFFETGKLARNADGAVTARWGDTVVLATAVIEKEPREGVDYLPLMVDYEERFYAAGKIKGSRFIKREGRPTDQAILSARLIDRPLRPLFPKHFRNDVQVVVTVLSADLEHSPDVLGIIAASAALLLSPVPFEGPVGAIRYGYAEGKLIANPTQTQIDASDLDLVVASVRDRIIMLEAGAAQIDDKIIAAALEQAPGDIAPLLKVQLEMAQDIIRVQPEPVNEEELALAIKEYLGKRLIEVLKDPLSGDRDEEIAVLKQDLLEHFEGKHKQADLGEAYDQIVEKKVREVIIDHGVRPDGRALDEIRPISIEIGLLPRTHGSAVFSRGQTQSLTIATLGSPGDEQTVETMDYDGVKRYMHHYNFPPYSVGEARPMRGPGRRDIGHGALAERALAPVIPSKEDFPYTIRLVSEILSSNGSSSMAATCASTLALLDAGVPIITPVGGIAIGLMTKPGFDALPTSSIKKTDYTLLTDIQGIEDFSGDMDFKVTGSAQGVTGIQLDMKVKGLPPAILVEGLERAKAARLKILELIKQAIPQPKELSPHAPRIISLRIDREKIGEVIGPGGKMIRSIIEQAGGDEVISIDIEDDGLVMITSTRPEAAEIAVKAIQGQAKEFKIGEVVDGTVEEILKDRFKGNEIGAIINLGGKNTGMVHISEISHERIPDVSSRLKIGDKVKVKVVNIDKERGRIGLSIKQNEENQS